MAHHNIVSVRNRTLGFTPKLGSEFIDTPAPAPKQFLHR